MLTNQKLADMKEKGTKLNINDFTNGANTNIKIKSTFFLFYLFYIHRIFLVLFRMFSLFIKIFKFILLNTL